MVYINLGGQLLSKLKERSMRSQSEKQKESNQRKAETSGVKKAEKNDGGRKALPDRRNSISQLATTAHIPSNDGASSTSSSASLSSSSSLHKSGDVKMFELPRSASEVVSPPSKGMSTQGFYSKAPFIVDEHSDGNGTRSKASECSRDSMADEPTVKKKKKKKKSLSFEAILQSVDKKMLQIKKKVSSVIEGKDTTTSAGSQASASEQGLPTETLVSGKNGKVKRGKIRAPSSVLLTASQRLHTPTEPDHGQPLSGLGLEKEDASASVPASLSRLPASDKHVPEAPTETGLSRPPASYKRALAASIEAGTSRPPASYKHVPNAPTEEGLFRPPASYKRGVPRTQPEVSYSIVERKELAFNG